MPQTYEEKRISDRAQVELRRLRASAIPKGVEDWRAPKAIAVNRAQYEVVVATQPGVQLDPKRRVAAEWKRTAYDGIPYAIDVEASGKLGDGTGENETGAPFKIRAISGPRRGEVRKVSAWQYLQIRGRCAHNAYPDFEPVPDAEKTRGPLLPDGFPTDETKAKAITARALGKDPDAVTEAEAIDHFAKRADDLKKRLAVA